MTYREISYGQGTYVEQRKAVERIMMNIGYLKVIWITFWYTLGFDYRKSERSNLASPLPLSTGAV